MTNYTNKGHAPQSVVRAVENDQYSSGGADLSCTTIIKSPQQVRLEAEHKEEIVLDIQDRAFSVLGTGVHEFMELGSAPWLAVLKKAFNKLLERKEAGDNVDEDLQKFKDMIGDMLERAVTWRKENRIYTERRFFTTIEVNGKEVSLSGQGDLTTGAHLEDYKCTSVWAVILGDKDEWMQQLSILRWLAHKNGVQIDTGSITTIFRDWKLGDFEKDKNSYQPKYPASPFGSLQQNLMSLDETEKFIRMRVAEHMAEVPRPCTDAERWAKPSTVAVKHKGNQTKASRLFKESDSPDYQALAEEYMAGLRSKHPQINAEFRQGVNTKCESYCSARDFCPQYKAYKHGN